MLSTLLLVPVTAMHTIICNGTSANCPSNSSCAISAEASSGICQCDEAGFDLGKESGIWNDTSDLECIPLQGAPCDSTSACPGASYCAFNYSFSKQWKYCLCDEGYNSSGALGEISSCVNIDECVALTHDCSDTADCTDTNGSFACSCRRWYEGDGVTCVATGDCERGIDNCPALSTCNSTQTGHTCTCDLGYDPLGDNSEHPSACVDIDECAGAHNCHGNASCSNTNGSFTCQCNEWAFTGDGVNCSLTGRCEIGLSNCHANATCTSTANLSFTCECVDGLEGNGVNCTDVDECALQIDNCAANVGVCTNTFGSFVCSCNSSESGYRDRDGNGVYCDNINECTDVISTNNCDENADCTDTEGSFQCECRKWDYTGNGTFCEATGACVLGLDDCPEEVSVCISTETNFTCNCSAGRDGDGYSCFDVDECDLCTNNCDLEAECINTDGSFLCNCNEGYEGNGTVCVDVCTTGNNTCHQNATCQMVPDDGEHPYRCECSLGFYGTGMGPFGSGTNCSDVTECGLTDDCDPNALCAETLGRLNALARTGTPVQGPTVPV